MDPDQTAPTLSMKLQIFLWTTKKIPVMVMHFKG